MNKKWMSVGIQRVSLDMLVQGSFVFSFEK